MESKIFNFKNVGNIRTTEGLITIGKRYTYKEGGRIGKITVEKVIPDAEYLRLQIYFYKVDLRIEVSHRLDYEGGYMGMWYICDESYYNENIEYYNTWEHYEDPPEIVPTLTKALFIAELSGEQKELLVRHFNLIYECAELNKKELNLTYLAHLLGEELVMQSEGMIIIDVKVEFIFHDYKEYIEDENESGTVNLFLIREFYQLDKVYKDILKS